MAQLPYIVPYDPAFLGGGFDVPMPVPCCNGALARCGSPLDYVHYSLVLHRDRRTAVLTAHNVDGNRRQNTRRNDDWDVDPRAPDAQTGPGAYSHNPWDRGHLVRRHDMSFGDTQKEAQVASDATFFYSNAAPQHARFNQDEWLALENWMLDLAIDDLRRLCVFTGPLYTRHDIVAQDAGGIRIPSAFWKVVVMRDPTADGDDLTAASFLMKQNEMWNDTNGASGIDFRVYQVGLRELSQATGLDFGDLQAVDEYEWRHVRFRDRRRMPWVPITGPGDLRLPGERRRRAGVRALRAPTTDDRATTLGRSRSIHDDGGDCGCGSGGRSLEARALERHVLLTHEMLDALSELVEQFPPPDQGAIDRFQSVKVRLGRIVGGTRVDEGAFPDCICIGDVDVNGDFFGFCTGVLIAPRVVLTAAHCAREIRYVRTGIESLVQDKGQLIRASRVVVHPMYAPNSAPSHDIALVILDEDAEQAPIAIATTEDVAQLDVVAIVGFGNNHPTIPTGFGIKRFADVMVTPGVDASAEQIAADEIQAGYDNDYELHAEGRRAGVDSCNGDSGGPAYLIGDGYVKLVALTSRAEQDFVRPCGDGGIYTRVAPYLDWIREVAGPLANGGGDPPALVPPPTTEGETMRIAQVMPNPASGPEWVELENDGGSPVDLEGWSISDKQGDPVPLQTTVPPGGKLVVTLPASGRPKLGNKNDRVDLKRPDGQIVDSVAWKSSKKGKAILGNPQAAVATDPVDPDLGSPPPQVEHEADWGADPC